MAALVCDICGGKLMAKAGGIFECEYCGMQYDKTRIQEMVQEIKGTVKVEGTVQVQGTVKVDGPVEVKGGVNIENLLKRGWLELQSSKWIEAKNAFDQALNYDAECAEAYLGMLCMRKHSACIEDVLAKIGVHVAKEDSDFQNALRFGDAAFVKKLRQQLEEAETRESAAAEEEARKREEEALRKEEEKRRKKEEARRKSEEAAVVCGEQRKKIAPAQDLLCWGRWNDLIGLRLDGTVMTDSGLDEKVKSWKDIIAISSGERHVVGLRLDGTVVAAGDNYAGQCNVGDWTDIVAISAGTGHTVGLRADGTAVATSDNNSWEACDVSGWHNIVAVSAGCGYAVGLCADGTLTVATGSRCRCEGLFSLFDWRNIVAISAGNRHVVGLRADGRVVAAGNNKYKECDVGDWTDIVAVSAGDATVGGYTLGLRVDGTVAVAGKLFGKDEVDGWRDIVAISSGEHHVVALRKDGAIVSEDRAIEGKLKHWKMFDDFETLAQVRTQFKASKLKEKLTGLQSEKAALQDEQTGLQEKLPTIKGLFADKRRSEIEARLAVISDRFAEIDKELTKLDEELAKLQ